jgi:hypothetical protein
MAVTRDSEYIPSGGISDQGEPAVSHMSVNVEVVDVATTVISVSLLAVNLTGLLFA